MASFIEFIEKFNQSIINLKNNDNLKGFLNEISSLNMSFDYDFDEVLKQLKEYKNVLDKITSIIYKPHIKVSTNPIILRSETAPSLSPNSFKETVKDSKLWKLKSNNEYSPEYVHSYENIDIIDNYENQFIATLIYMIDEQFKVLKDSLSFINDCLEEHFNLKETTFNEFGIYEQYELYKYPYTSFLYQKNETAQEVKDELNKLSRKIKAIKGSKFYLINSKRLLLNRLILPTNVLIHDSLYNYCFKFYNNNFKNEGVDSNLLSSFYINYVTISFIKYLSNEKNKVSFSNVKLTLNEHSILNFDLVKFKRKFLTFNIYKDQNIENLIHLDVDVQGKKVSAKYLIFIEQSLNEENFNLINSLDIVKESDGAIFITMNNKIKKYQGVINYSPFNKIEIEKIFDNLFKSFSLIYKVSSLSSFIKRCPICGEETIFNKGEAYECLSCGAKYSIFKVEDEDVIWIKSLRRKG